MYEGKPMVLVIGGSDTGRTPMAAGLLRKALGNGVVVRTAGVVPHAGEGATPEAQMALEQLSIDISRHISHPLRHEEHRNAELLLAVDRGTELVLFAEFPNDPRVTCLPILANAPDVLDPHRMPLGIWIAAARQLNEQITQALPHIRQRLNVQEEASLPTQERRIERRESSGPQPLVLGTGHKTQWATDEEMQRLMGLIENSEARPENGAASEIVDQQAVYSQQDVGEDDRARVTPVDHAQHTPHDQPNVTTSPPQQLEQSSPRPLTGSRTEHVNRIVRMLDVAEEMPEIVDWLRLRQEVVNRLRAVAQQAEGPMDFAPAAILMIEGKLMQQATQPPTNGLHLLRKSVQHLATALKASDLALIGGELGQW